MNKNKKLLLTMLISTSIIGCGGGGSNDSNPEPNTTNKLSGKAIDGYFVGATFFLDVNYNGIFDSNEPSTTTTENDGSNPHCNRTERIKIPSIRMFQRKE